MKCFYHIDDDGKCAGAIVKQEFPDCEMYPIDYKDNFPLNTIETGEMIYIVDFSIEPEMMSFLLAKTNNVIWIDHHKTAIEKYRDYPMIIDGIREVGKSGCLLTWEWFYKDMEGIEKPMAILLINDWDLWLRKMEPETSMFKAGLDSLNTDPNNKDSIWKLLLDPSDTFVLYVLEIGESVLGYKEQFYNFYVENYGYETEWESHLWFVINLAKSSSDAFKFVSNKSYDGFISYVFDGKKYSVSLYSNENDLDVSKIAVRNGGGGHTGAAGFICSELPFKIR